MLPRAGMLLFHRAPPLFAHIKKLSETAFSSRYLLFTNLGVSVSLSGLGDALQQKTKRSKMDTQRLRHMAAAGLPVGFICHYWYLWLDRYLPGRTLQTLLKKVAWDQLLLSPVMWVAYFLFLNALRQEKESMLASLKVQDQVHEVGTQIYMAEWLVWPPAQIVNFYFLPTRFRVVYDNLVSLGFDMYVSYLVNDQKDKDDDPVNDKMDIVPLNEAEKVPT